MYAKKRALLVGINQYENPANNLNGCVNDAVDMAETLKICGFPRTKIKLLTNEAATKAGILKGLDWLTAGVVDGDVLVFYYSGHGSQVADLDNDETDRQDEIICPHDISWSKKTYITDDDLHNYFSKKLPEGVRTDVILDSCFSGTATRSGAIHHFGSLGSKRQQRYLPPPTEHLFRITSAIPQYTKREAIGDKLVAKSQFNSLWAGCQENQVSWELLFDDQVRGAFTYYFTRILRRSNGNMSRREIYETLRPSMAEDGFEQIPALEGPENKPEALDLFPFRKEREVDRPSEVKKK
jgi:hypothetical protein